MKFLIVLALFLLAPLANTFAQPAESAHPEIVKLDWLLNKLEQKSDKILVVNFWATWCAPCVKELPLFEKVTQQKSENIEVTLISMDLDLDPNPEKVYKFVDRKKMVSRVYILNEPNANEWIDRIDKRWNGALPATIIINRKTGQRVFVERALQDGELEKMIAAVKQ